MLPLIVTGYTPEYEEAANSLERDAERLGLAFRGIPYDDRGAWHFNCRYKPWLIESALRSRPILWIDADAHLLRRPDLLNSATFIPDLAICPSRAQTGRSWCTGTIYITPAARWFLYRWMGFAAQLDTDEQGLNEAWKKVPLPRTHRLSNLYGWLPTDGPPNDRVVIQHVLSGNASKYQIERGGSK